MKKFSKIIVFIFSMNLTQNLFAKDEVREINMTLKHVNSSDFKCYSYDNGVSNAYWTINGREGFQSLVLFVHKDLESFDRNSPEKCRLVDEVRETVSKNNGSIEVKIIVSKSVMQSESYRCTRPGGIYTGCSGVTYLACSTTTREEIKIIFPNGLQFIDGIIPYNESLKAGKCTGG